MKNNSVPYKQYKFDHSKTLTNTERSKELGKGRSFIPCHCRQLAGTRNWWLL